LSDRVSASASEGVCLFPKQANQLWYRVRAFTDDLRCGTLGRGLFAAMIPFREA
jgi:hypothetical protein